MTRDINSKLCLFCNDRSECKDKTTTKKVRDIRATLVYCSNRVERTHF